MCSTHTTLTCAIRITNSPSFNASQKDTLNSSQIKVFHKKKPLKDFVRKTLVVLLQYSVKGPRAFRFNYAWHHSVSAKFVSLQNNISTEMRKLGLIFVSIQFGSKAMYLRFALILLHFSAYTARSLDTRFLEKPAVKYSGVKLLQDLVVNLQKMN